MDTAILNAPNPPATAGWAGVDPSEVAYYERLAHRWWDASGPFWPLHRLNGLRLEYVREQVCAALGRDAGGERPLAGLTVLDIGCGGGILSEAMARLGARVSGIDPTERNIVVASHHAEASGLAIDYRHTTAEVAAAAGEGYDVVLNMEVVEHVADLPAFMAAATALVRPAGVMVVATLNRTPVSWLFGIVGAEYVLRWLPRGTHRWDRFVRPDEAERLLARGGLQVIGRSGVRVNPVTRHFSLTRWMAVNYMLVAVKRG
ncbi:MAG: bifunctional 2-polyprenyl-6-hydroxyphenol methylase/3-demethylubiquinol 3-O-methyltransferase UbiG [Gammaproteobacteria bacterium]|jgi:2-polyprenyl-6-hydroxyphenyl methylase/3-demethylubiquinone-9 3-methyltransferase|nr:bifunctional 2-polyprenyl-6-hydroxyphenol methylase/3-demethylubiquinol 3-O-methyltransferase UbiG [Gammaproteobacteria bacterium]